MSRSRNKFLFATFVFLLALDSSILLALEKSPRQQTPPDEFSYSSQDRRDPFESLYETKIKKQLPEMKKKEGYELEELKLVGVVKTGDVKFAMMEDVQGRGLLFKKGDFLNSSVWLLDVLDDKVILAHKLRGDIRKISLDIPRK
jgi:Tfp pilus assembly protein PilP